MEMCPIRQNEQVLIGTILKGETTLVKLQGSHQKTSKLKGNPPENPRKTQEDQGRGRGKAVINFTLAAPLMAWSP